MKQEDILKALVKAGVNTTRQTIARYEDQCLIPKADRSNKGQPGKAAEYPRETVEQFIASNRLLSGKYGDEGLRDLIGGNTAPPASPKAISTARLVALYTEESNQCKKDSNTEGAEQVERNLSFILEVSDIDSEMGRLFIDFLAIAWKYERDKARRTILI